MAASLPSPGTRAGTVSGACARIQSIQSSHQVPGVSVAVATQSSKLPSVRPPAQYWYLALAGGLTTPAMCPDPAMT